MEIVNQDLDGSLSLSLSTEIPIYMERDLSMNRSRLSSIRIDMSERLRRSLYVLATSVSAPKRKVWIFQSYVVRDVTYVRSIRYHSFWCSMIHLRIMSR